MIKLALTAVVALVIGAATSTSHFSARAARAPESAAACNPVKHFCNAGVLTAGVYTTRYFVPGMRVTVPPGGWRSSEDSRLEFKLSPPNARNNDTLAIRFWIDPHASTPCSDKIVPIDITTPARVIAWLRGDKNLIVSNQRRATIAGHLAAVRVDLDVSASAPQCASACPGPCIDYFLFRALGGTEPYGTGRGQPVRLYFTEVGKPTHLFVVGVDAPNRKAFAILTASATKILASLRLPDHLPPGRR
jgi:hypothetical protein